MTHREGNIVHLVGTDPAKCSDCGAVKELRPYGKGGAWVCLSCAMKDEDEAVAQFSGLLEGKRDI